MTVKEYIESYSPRYRGHTPGHKGKLAPGDITEILDDFPGDLIREAEKRAEALYGAPHLRFLTNGSSIGIKASVLALGEDFITDGYCHRAVTEASRLARVSCLKLNNPTAENGLPELTTAEMLKKAMESSGIKNAVIQYPDYYGRTCDLEAIASVVHGRGGTLICDSAHGAHFALRPDLFPTSAVALSDMCNMSAHKTLGAMTQTAFLACRREWREKIDEKLDDLGTTSPNYLLIASLESATDEAQEKKSDYDRLKNFSDELRAQFTCLENDDFTRLVVDFGEANGKRSAYLLKGYGVVCEKYDNRRVVFILTLYDEGEELKVLVSAIKKTIKDLK